MTYQKLVFGNGWVGYLAEKIMKVTLKIKYKIMKNNKQINKKILNFKK